MAKRKGRGRPKGSSRQKKVKASTDDKVVTLDNPSNVLLEVDHGFIEEQETGTDGLSRQKNVKESADDEVFILDNPSNVFLEVDPGFIEEQETDAYMPKKRGRGRPKRSRAQNCQESIHRNLSSHINPSNMVEVSPECEESEDAVMPKEKGQGQPRGSMMQNCQENAGDEDIYENVIAQILRDETIQENASGEDIYDNPSNVIAQILRDVNTPMRRGRGRPRGSTNQKNRQQNSDDISVFPKRKGRGRTRGLTLEMKRKLSPDGKLDVLIHPTRLVAVGPGRNDFITDLSIIVRKNARLNVHKWKQVTQNTRDTIVQKILDNWRLPDTDIVRKAILGEAGRLYRNWRNRLHEYYLMFETKEEALKHVPDEINGSDWKILVDYFSSPSFEIMSMKNKANKAKQLMNHTSGQKSFQAVSYDARDPATGKEPDLQTLWQMTHKRANGEWVDMASKEVNDKVAEQINEKLCQLENSQDGMETIEPEIISTAFKTVVGKKSYMQGFGAGLSSSSSIRVQHLQGELDAQRIETENARKECNEIRAKLVEVESQLEEERRKRKEVEARLLDRQKEMQEINNQVQTAIQSALSQYRPPTTEAETSSKNGRKIAELEAQLHEAEDVITDIRSELARYRMG